MGYGEKGEEFNKERDFTEKRTLCSRVQQSILYQLSIVLYINEKSPDNQGFCYRVAGTVLQPA